MRQTAFLTDLSGALSCLCLTDPNGTSDFNPSVQPLVNVSYRGRGKRSTGSAWCKSSLGSVLRSSADCHGCEGLRSFGILQSASFVFAVENDVSARGDLRSAESRTLQRTSSAHAIQDALAERKTSQSASASRMLRAHLALRDCSSTILCHARKVLGHACSALTALRSAKSSDGSQGIGMLRPASLLSLRANLIRWTTRSAVADSQIGIARTQDPSF